MVKDIEKTKLVQKSSLNYQNATKCVIRKFNNYDLGTQKFREADFLAK